MATIEVPAPIVEKWQRAIDCLADILHVPSGLVMRINQGDIEVFVASQTEDNPYTTGDSEHLVGSGLYCETVIQTRKTLLVPNALTDQNWNTNPDIELGMISYMGLPLMMPGGEVFGTICVLNNKEDHYSELHEKILSEFKGLIESHLVLLDQTAQLNSQLEEIKTLRGIVPICARCKNVRDAEGYWHAVEVYVRDRTEAEFSHGLCPPCGDKLYPGLHKA